MKQKQKRKREPHNTYHWDKYALIVLCLQSTGFGAFILWCIEEQIPSRYSLPPIIVGMLILATLFLMQLAKARQGKDWWDDDTCSGWRGY